MVYEAILHFLSIWTPGQLQSKKKRVLWEVFLKSTLNSPWTFFFNIDPFAASYPRHLGAAIHSYIFSVIRSAHCSRTFSALHELELRFKCEWESSFPWMETQPQLGALHSMHFFKVQTNTTRTHRRPSKMQLS